MRPRAECCERLALADLRPLVQPGDAALDLPDGTTLALRWSGVRGCFGGQTGRSLLLVCPTCDRSCRVLWQPPGERWGCCCCWRISYRSHRRSGSRKGQPKPRSWHCDRLQREQLRCAELLGLESWPPPTLFWRPFDLLTAPRRSDAPRLRFQRQVALVRRLDALESLRIGSVVASSALPLHWPKRVSDDAAAVVESTAWALRRPAGDPRSTRGRDGRACS
jgi:hypothetical protein